jgi:hypothetical protein
MNLFLFVLIFQVILFVVVVIFCLKIERYNTAVSSNAIIIKDWIKKNYTWSLFKTVEQDILDRENIIPSGLVIGKYFIAWINMNQVNYGYSTEIFWDIWICYRFERPNLISQDKSVNKEMTVLKKVRPHLGAIYEEVKIACVVLDKPEFKLLENTAKEIIDFAKKSRGKIGIFNCITLITGPSGRGKSHITKYIAKLLDYTPVFVEDFDPTSPAQSIEMILREAKPLPDKILVVMLTEVDKIIERFHSGKIQPHTNFSTQVRDKDSWNSLLDYMCFIDNCIVIMTTNKSYQHFFSLDPSYLRKGRVHKIYNFGGDKEYMNTDVKTVLVDNVAQLVLDDRLSVV